MVRRNVKVAFMEREPDVNTAAESNKKPWGIVDMYSRQYPDDPRYTDDERTSRAKNIADAMAMAGDFHDRIQVPTKKEFAGVPGKDYDDTYWRPGFRPRARATRMDNLKGTMAVASRSHAGDPWVTFNDRMGFLPKGGYMEAKKLYPMAAHEVGHLSSMDVLPGTGGRVTGDPLEGSGRSKRERDILDAAYRFDKGFWGALAGGDEKGINKANAEQGATNTGYRASIDAELADRLGRKPTYQEFKDYIKGMSAKDIKDRYKRYANAYIKMIMMQDGSAVDKAFDMKSKGMSDEDIQETLWKDFDPIGDDKERIEAIRKAWLEVARARMASRARRMA